jgi:hypothetical protein
MLSFTIFVLSLSPMNVKQASRILPLLWFFLCADTLVSAPLTVTDTKGRSIEIELISVNDGDVTFSRKGDPKEFTLPLTNFAETSQKLIKTQAALLPKRLPKMELDAVIGKRRRKDGSYYMVRQEITTTVKITNRDLKQSVPEVEVKLIHIGQNRRTSDIYTILSKQSFKTTIDPAQTITKEMRSFITSYDSDNKGYGNIGGFEYQSYILAVLDPEGKVAVYSASTPSLRKLIESNQHLLEDLLAYPRGKMLTSEMEPSDTRMIYTVPN